MKKNIIYILLLVSFIGFSQQEQENYAKISKEFLCLYNAKKYASIFNLFDNNMKNKFPLKKTTSFLNSLFKQRGEISEMVFSDLKGTAHIYKTTFKIGVRSFLLSLNKNNEINSMYIRKYIPKNLPILERNTTKMILPFNEEWTVFWGGITVEDNYHVAYNNQKYAYDLAIVKNGKSFKNDRSKNENFYAFGKEIIAPCNGTIVKVFNGVKDNIPGKMNPDVAHGNSIILKTNNNEFITFSHFKENSIRVMKNQIVKQGDILGLCGNSGNSSEPHLHISLQNIADKRLATGGKLYFNTIKVNGKTKEDYIPIKNDKVQNIN